MTTTRQWGDQVSFTTGNEIDPLTQVTSQQTIGWVGLQTVPANVTLDQLNMLNTGDLADIADRITVDTGAQALYISLSWNASGLTVTDLQIGVVVKAGSASFLAGNLRNATMDNWLGQIMGASGLTVMGNNHLYLLDVGGGGGGTGGISLKTVGIILAGIGISAAVIGGIWYYTKEKKHHHHEELEHREEMKYG